MKPNVQITCHNLSVEMTSQIEPVIRKKAEQLEKYFSRITSLHILVEPALRRHHKGNLYHVRIDMVVPGREIVASRTPTEHHEHEELHVAVRDAFLAARRQLQDYVQSHFGGKANLVREARAQ